VPNYTLLYLLNGVLRNNCLSQTPEHEVRATVSYKRDVCPKSK